MGKLDRDAHVVHNGSRPVVGSLRYGVQEQIALAVVQPCEVRQGCIQAFCEINGVAALAFEGHVVLRVEDFAVCFEERGHNAEVFR